MKYLIKKEDKVIRPMSRRWREQLQKQMSGRLYWPLWSQLEAVLSGKMCAPLFGKIDTSSK